MKNVRLSINQDLLKIVALITMTIDHVSKFLLSGVISEIGICIGRMSFPIFAFLLMKHLEERKIYKKYIIRLSVFGVLSLLLVFIFSVVLKEVQILPLNILFSFLNIVLFFLVIEWVSKEELTSYLKAVVYGFVFMFFGVLSLVLDYGFYGFLFMTFLYLYFKNRNMLLFVICLVLSLLMNGDISCFIISFLTTIILFCNNYDKKQKRIITHWWIFYVYYPLHLLIIMMIKLAL